MQQINGGCEILFFEWYLPPKARGMFHDQAFIHTAKCQCSDAVFLAKEHRPSVSRWFPN